jgi:DNA primase
MATKTSLLNAALGDYRKSGNELLFFCPACSHHKKKLSVNITTNNYKCWICDFRGKNVRKLLKTKLSYSQLYEWDKLNNVVDLTQLDSNIFDEAENKVEETIQLPEEFISLANKNLPLASKFALKYLKDRAITKEDILSWKIGFCTNGEYKNRIIVPSFNEDGNVNYFVARSYTNEFPKYKNPKVSKDIVFNELYLNWNNDITIVEGVFDAMKAQNAIPLLGSTLNQQSNLFTKLISYDPKVFIALDPDAEKKASSLIQNLIGYGIEIYKIDVTGYEDVGTMPKHVFVNRKEKAELITEDWNLNNLINLAV